MNVNYYLQSCDYSGDAPHKGFGIEARLFNEDRLIDSCAVADIACSRTEVLALIELLSRNTVTPVTLKDIVDDYIDA